MSSRIEWINADFIDIEYLPFKELNELSYEEIDPQHQGLCITTLDGDGIVIFGTVDSVRNAVAAIADAFLTRNKT